MSKRVFLHVATPKSGTTYLQAVLWRNADALGEASLLLPGTFDAHYVAAKAVTERTRMRHTGIDPRTAWTALAASCDEWDGDALISHELMAPATTEQAQRALDQLKPTEIHLLITARALHRQIPAAWQHGIRGGRSLTLETFAYQVRNRTRRGVWFWSVQDVAAIANRWAAAGIAPENIHIVTVPRDASEPTELWRRYASVLGLDPSRYDADIAKQNRSLGRAETELVRRLHRLRDDRFPGPRNSRETLAMLDEILSRRRSDPIWLPDESEAWLGPLVGAMISEITDQGYGVTGDLADLCWQPAPSHVETGSAVSDEQVHEVVTWTVEQLCARLHKLAPEVAELAPASSGVVEIVDLLDQIRVEEAHGEPAPGLRPVPIERS